MPADSAAGRGSVDRPPSQSAVMRTASSGARPRAASSLSHSDAPETRYEAHDAAAAHNQDKLLALAAGEPPHAARKRFLCWSLTKRRWRLAVCASVGLVVALVVLLVVFLAVVPAIFQKYVDKVQLSVNYMDIKTLSTDASRNEIDVELSLRVTYDASVSASMEDAAATLLYKGKPFGAVTLPAQQFAKGNASFDFVVRNVAEISDAAVFRALSRALVTDEQVTIDTRATVTARAMGLSYGGLTLDRAFAIKAFDNFRDPKPRVNNITLAECAGAAYKLLINATLDNDAQAGIGGIGALNLSVYHEQNYLGQALSTDASLGLPRGPTDMVLELTVVKTPELLAAMLGMVGGLLGPSGVQFYVRGDHANATRAPLLDEAFNALNISMLYTDGLSKLTVSPTCNLMAILSGGR